MPTRKCLIPLMKFPFSLLIVYIDYDTLYLRRRVVVNKIYLLNLLKVDNATFVVIKRENFGLVSKNFDNKKTIINRLHLHLYP